MLIEFIVCMIAGIGAGVGTGFAGLSAAVVISPMLVTFLGFDAFEAVGIALSSDVLASAVSAYTYGKNRHLDIKNGLVMLFTVLIFTMVGSLAASYIPSTTLGSFSLFMTFLLGLRFIFFPVMNTSNRLTSERLFVRVTESVICGMVIGFICGFVGAGGGMMMLMILTLVLGYELKTAVGTSVFIMTFTAFTGAVSHFMILGHIPNVSALILCIIFTFIGALVSSRFANESSTKTMNRITGIVLVVLGSVMLVVRMIS